MEKTKKVSENLQHIRKSVTLHPLFGVTAGWAEVLPVMLRWNDKQYLIIKKMDLIKVAEEAFATGKKFPEFKSGDTITVAYKIIEGSKERIQLYRGVVIKISGHGDKKRFTVRKMSGTVGVERIFPIESPASILSRLTSMVKYVALSCTTSVSLQVRRLVSLRRRPSLKSAE